MPSAITRKRHDCFVAQAILLGIIGGMSKPMFLVDAFADVPFSGNPAAVCLLPTLNDAAWMQSVAMEMQQSETAFVAPRGEDYDLRWFTPTVEVDLCGHATLATAHILFSTGRAKGRVRFFTRSGLLTASETATGIELDFPAELPTAEPLPFSLESIPTPVWTGRNRMDWVIEVPTEDQVRNLRPDFSELARLGMRGVVVTARSKAFDFVSRGFFPNAGINEDSVTGSAHCALAPYWANKLEKSAMVGFQASLRGGVVEVRVEGDRVMLGGKARTFLSGEIQ